MKKTTKKEWNEEIKISLSYLAFFPLPAPLTSEQRAEVWAAISEGYKWLIIIRARLLSSEHILNTALEFGGFAQC